MNPDRIRAAIRTLYPDEMTPTARNVLENILDDEELEAVADAAASLCPRCKTTALEWHDGWGYRCPECFLFVALPPKNTHEAPVTTGAFSYPEEP